MSNPLLQQALAHMPQDPTHAIRSDIQEEWKKQEQMQDMRKKAMELQKRYQSSGRGGGQQQPGSQPLFEAEFDSFGRKGNSAHGPGHESEESGADLELAGEDQDVSDLSSHEDAEEFG